MSYTWAQFKAAVDDLLLTDANRAGTENAKLLQVKLGTQKLQECVERYRIGHQDLYGYSDLIPEGFSSKGELPDDAEISDAYMVGTVDRSVSNTVDTSDDELTVTSHDITSAQSTLEVEVGRFYNTGGSLPGGLVEGQSYFIRVVDGDTITLHTSSQGALDNTNRVDITSNGSGTTTLKYALKRYSLESHEWKDRHELIEAAVAMTGAKGFISIDPNSQDFLTFPQVPVGEDSNNRTWRVEINWSGIKLEWDENDTTPFDELAVNSVAEHVTSWFRRAVDNDLPAAEAADRAHKRSKASAYLKGRRQKEVQS